LIRKIIDHEVVEEDLCETPAEELADGETEGW